MFEESSENAARMIIDEIVQWRGVISMRGAQSTISGSDCLDGLVESVSDKMLVEIAKTQDALNLRSEKAKLEILSRILLNNHQ